MSFVEILKEISYGGTALGRIAGALFVFGIVIAISIFAWVVFWAIREDYFKKSEGDG